MRRSVAEGENALLLREAAGHRPAFRRVVVLRAIRAALAARAGGGAGPGGAGGEVGAGEGAGAGGVMEANRPVELDAALAMAADAAEDARLRRRAHVAQALRAARRGAAGAGLEQGRAGSPLGFGRFAEAVRGMDPHVTNGRAAHIYRVPDPARAPHATRPHTHRSPPATGMLPRPLPSHTPPRTQARAGV